MSDAPTTEPTDGSGPSSELLSEPPSEPPSSEPKPSRTRRWLWPALLVVVWLAVGGPLGSFQGQLASVAENDNAAFLPQSAEATRVSELQTGFADQPTIPAIVVYERTDGITPEDLSVIEEDIAELGGLNGLIGGVSPALPSEDGQAVQVIVPLDAELGEGLADVVGEVRDIVGDGSEAGFDEVAVTGPGGLLADLGEAFGAIDGILILVTAAVVAIILVLVYRSPLLPVVVLLGAGLALGVAAAAVYGLVQADVLTLNGQSQGILLILVFGASTDYALLLVSRYREEFRGTDDPTVAIRRALRASAAPILASGATVIIGLLCLLFSDLNSNRGLGPVAAIGIASSLLVQLTFLPAALSLLGRNAFWPRRPSRGDPRPGDAGIWRRVSDLVGSHPRRVWAGTLILLFIAASFVFSLRIGGASQVDILLTETDAKTGQEVLDRHGLGGGGSPAIVVGPAEDVDDLVSTIESVEGIDAATVTSDPPPGAPPGTPGGEPKVVDGMVEISATLSGSADGAEGFEVIATLRTALDDVGDGSALVGGITATNLDTQDTANRDLRLIIPIVLAVVFVILSLLLRALLIPLLLIGTVVVSYVATLGIAELVFDHILGFPPADPAVPLFGFVFLVALGIDYNIFLMTRVREEALQRGTRPGLLQGLRVTGGVITSAGVVLAATFAALGVIPILFLAQIAFIVAFGVLLDTILVRSLLVPALSYDIGARIWWPSALARRDESAHPS